MTYLEHKELADCLRHEATQALHESVEAARRVCELHEEDAGYEEWSRQAEVRDSRYQDYVRLSKLSNKHMGIYRMVCTQRALRAERSAA